MGLQQGQQQRHKKMLKKSKASINHHQKNAKILIRSWRREALVKKFHSGDHYHHLYAKKNYIKAILTFTTRTTTTALKKTKKSPKIQHILNDHHQKPGKTPFRSEAKVDLAKEFHSWDYYSHSYAKKIKKIYN